MPLARNGGQVRYLNGCGSELVTAIRYSHPGLLANCRRLMSGGGHAFLHLFRRYIFRVRSDVPDVAKRISQATPSVTVELILYRHFLLRACQYLAEEIATNPHSSVPDVPADSPGEATAHSLPVRGRLAGGRSAPTPSCHGP